MANSFVLATARDLNPDLFDKHGFIGGDKIEVTLETRGRGKDGKGPMRWAVCHQGFCLSKKDLDFSRESMPSNRTEEYMKEYRFTSKEEAYEAFLKWLEIEKAINNARLLLNFWTTESDSFSERPESEQAALMCIRHMDEWKTCLIHNSSYLQYGHSEEKIYPRRSFYKLLKKVTDKNHFNIIKDLYEKVIRPIRKKSFNDRSAP